MAVKKLEDISPMLVLLFFLLLNGDMVSATVHLVGKNVSLSFEDMEASFAPSTKSGKYGILHVADPLDACSNMINNREISNNSNFFLLIERGGCSFEEKVRAAQNAGYQAAIVYDKYDEMLIVMAGNSVGIRINAVFVSKKSGETLKQYAGSNQYKVFIVPSFENSAWSIMAISFISLLSMSVVLATCFFVRRHRIRRLRPNPLRVQEFQRMSKRSVKAMPSLIFTTVHEDYCTSRVCAICLEDYSVGEKLRILPCRHKFHSVCVDSWLTKWRTFCPVCKRDARTQTSDPPPSESTPLLSSSSISVSSSLLSSFTPPTRSPSLQPPPLSSPPVPLPLSIPRPPYFHHSPSSYHQSPYINVTRSSGNLSNLSSQRNHNSFMTSSPLNSLEYPSFSPLNSSIIRYGSGLGSSSGFQNRVLLRDDSAGTLTPYASSHTLPDH